MTRRLLVCLLPALLACGGTSSGGTSSSSASSGASSSGGSTSSFSSDLLQSSSSAAAGSSSGSTGSTSQSTGSRSSSSGRSSTSAAIPDNAGCVLADGGPAIYCSARCTDIGSDIQNCGACDVVCPNGSCVGGSCLLVSCVGLTGGSDCELGDGGHDAGPDAGHGTCCNGSCFAASQFDTDAHNCGSCGFGCATGATCKSAACTLAGTATQGLCGPCTGTCTKGLCSKTGLHCGACATGEVCIDTDPNYGGICVGDTCTKKADGVICELGTSANPDPGICCGATCVDENTNPVHCGACGSACAAGLVCYQGVCLGGGCSPGEPGGTCALDAGQLGICCGGSGCVDPTSDLANCGGCGELCPSLASSCKGGSCLLLGDGGAATCTLPAAGCPTGAVCNAFPASLTGPLTNGFTCTSTACAADGDPCYLNPSATGLCCAGSCVDPTEDPANCGGCGLACASGICVAGAAGTPQLDAIASNCLPPSPPTSTDCSASGGCPAGWSCIDGLCLPPDCATSGLCAVDGGNPGVCCQIAGQGYCVDVANDSNNCGGCGSYCPFGQTCVQGVCSGTRGPCSGADVNDACDLSAGPLNLCCPGGGCVNTLSDPANCGGCGVACGDDGGCVAGVCQ